MIPSRPGIAGRVSRPHRRNNRKLVSTVPPTPAQIVETAIGPEDKDLTITFDSRVVVRGVPQWPLADARLPVSATLVDPTTLRLTYAGENVESTTYSVPAGDTSVRSFTGGAVPPGDYPTGFVGMMAATTESAPTSPRKKAA